MTDQDLLVDALDARVQRRENRRDFFKSIGGVAALMGGAAAVGGIGSPAGAQAAPTDADVLNFALNLEYLEAQFYFFAVFGEGLPSSILGGAGTRGNVRGGRRVNFSDPIVARFAREIALDERAHVEFLRTAIGASAVAQPEIDISSDPNGSFSAAARAAGLIGAGQSFDPYANDENFLLGAFIFEDVGVTAYKGAAPLITNKTFLEASAGILAVEAYHAAMIRTTIFQKGVEGMASLIDASERISNARDSLDDPTDKDQGVAPRGNASNIAPLDDNGIAFSRPAADVLNIVYLTSQAANQGGFFPNGVNGTIRASSAF
jgi:hypothetical protein